MLNELSTAGKMRRLRENRTKTGLWENRRKIQFVGNFIAKENEKKMYSSDAQRICVEKELKEEPDRKIQRGSLWATQGATDH